MAAQHQLLNQRMEQFLRKPIEHAAVDVQRTTAAFEIENLHVTTVEVAIILLGEYVEPSQSEKLYDFLDSAATYFYQQGTPLKLLAGQGWVPDGDITAFEREHGFIFAPAGLGCMRSGAQSNGLDVFELRTDLLLDAAHRPENETRMAKLRRTQAKKMSKIWRRRKSS